jgi:anaerobic magnesium-protoporphyrin IX monomethyl ester cyclase
MMKASGCTLVSFGIESGVQRLLDRIGKRTTLEQSERAVRLAKEAGLRVRATLMLGLPGETREDSLETIRFSRRLPVDQVRFALATPFPGTELWRIAEEEGTLKVDDWMNLSLMAGYRQGQLAWVPKGRETKELKRLQRRANLGFFLRPRSWYEYVSRVRSPHDIAEYALGAWQLMRASVLGKQ